MLITDFVDYGMPTELGNQAIHVLLTEAKRNRQGWHEVGRALQVLAQDPRYCHAVDPVVIKQIQHTWQL